MVVTVSFYIYILIYLNVNSQLSLFNNNTKYYYTKLSSESFIE